MKLGRARLDLRIGLALLGVWIAITALVILFHLPFWLAKFGLGCCAAAWAVHVIAVVRRNTSDRRSTEWE